LDSSHGILLLVAGIGGSGGGGFVRRETRTARTIPTPTSPEKRSSLVKVALEYTIKVMLLSKQLANKIFNKSRKWENNHAKPMKQSNPKHKSIPATISRP
jgi:hypothetical protein